MSGESPTGAVADPPAAADIADGHQPGASSGRITISIVGMIQTILIVCQTILLVIGAAYISWWPNNINIYASERNLDETLGDTEDENRILQIWQSIYLGVSLLCTFYGVCMLDRGWLMLSMFLNIGIMSLLPFRTGGGESPFTCLILIFGIASVTLCFILSERIQNLSLMNSKVEPEDLKRQILFCDIPTLSIYHFGAMQALTSCTMIFMGLLWMLLQEAMITVPVRNFSCNGWPKNQCYRYYGFKGQEYYVGRMTIAMCVAGAAGVVSAFLKKRAFCTVAMVLTLLPFTGIIENSIYTLGNSEDVSYLCTDEWWTRVTNNNSKLKMFWGEEWDCNTQENYHRISVMFMIIASTISLFHLWICLRFSEKIQSYNETIIDEELPSWFDRLCEWCMESKRLIKLMLILSVFVGIGGIVQIAYGADAASSKQEEINWSGENVRIMDNLAYIDGNYIYGVLSVISAASVWLYFFYRDRAILCLVFCLLVETSAIGFQNLIWHEIDLEYGIIEFALNSIEIYPVYINGEARDTLYGSVQVYYFFNILIMITIFTTVLASEAIQEERKEEALSHVAMPMAGILD